MNVKRFAVAAFSVLVVLGFQPVSAGVNATRVQYPWKAEYINKSNNIRSISMSHDGATGQPLAMFYNTDASQFYHAKLVGEGAGDCGTNRAWTCLQPLTNPAQGIIYDTAHYENSATGTLITGFVFFDDVEETVNYLEWSNQDGRIALGILDYHSHPGPISLSLAYDGVGDPQIALSVATNVLYYLHLAEGPDGTCPSLTGDGSARWDCDPIAQESEHVTDPSITIGAANSPHIVYYDPIDTSLRYAHPDSGSEQRCDLNPNWRCIPIEQAGNVGQYPSLAYGDALHVAYYNSTQGTLRLAKYVGIGGNCGAEVSGLFTLSRWQCETIDTIGMEISNVGISLAMDGIEPLIAYKDSSASISRVKLAQRASRAGLDSGNCGSGSPLRYFCEVIDQGPYDLGSELDLAVNSNGLVNIAYLEDNYDAMQNHLLVARQYVPLFLPVVLR